MRDPKRISDIEASIDRLWRLYPDWRLGQLLVNVAMESSWNNSDIFYLDDGALELALDDFYKKTIHIIERKGNL
jgi:hypothetical protein